jgi:hypothetical protein
LSGASETSYPGGVNARTLALACVVGSIPPGCAVAQGRSCDVAAGGISMSVVVTDDDDGVEVEVELEAGDMSGTGTSLQLCPEGGESLTVNGREFELTEAYTGHFKYRAELDEPAESYELHLVIGSDAVEVTTTIVPPPGLSVQAPPAGAEISRGAELELQWAPPDPERTLTIDLVDDEILCLADWSADTPDDGSHVIPAGTIVRSDPEAPDGRCDAEYVFTRVRDGGYPAELESGGSVQAVVRRSVRFASVP